MQLPSQVIQTAKKIRILLLFVALLYFTSYLLGWYLISIRSPIAISIAQSISRSVLTEAPFTTVTQSLKSGNLAQAVLTTFLWNLTVGAFLSTTLPGIVPFFGSLATVAITLVRGFTVGLVYPEILSSSAAGFTLGFGTMILELGAYVFSGAAGIHIALAPIIPRRYGAQSRLAAFKTAWKDAARIYVIVVVLLALGAIWEMTGIFLLLPK